MSIEFDEHIVEITERISLGFKIFIEIHIFTKLYKSHISKTFIYPEQFTILDKVVAN